MVKLRWTSEAEEGLREIHDYIARDRPRTARRTIESIVHRTESLIEFPQQGESYAFRSDRTVRILTYGHFQIAYLKMSPKSIAILGVFHGLIFLPLK
ncbi:MAG: type II toxin-antitoxin system RelE/ParE family toxin [Thermoanaerobaculia bacterium]